MRDSLGGPAIAILASVLAVGYDWHSGENSSIGEAVVVQSSTYHRSGRTIAEVRHRVDGRLVEATLRAWYRHLRAGQRVDILYTTGEPEDVWLDEFWQRHFRSAIVLTITAVVLATSFARSLAAARRSASALLGDDEIIVPASSRGSPRLPIDTSPRLWDRDLDGPPGAEVRR